MLPLIPLFAVIAPFIVWPIEVLLPYPYIIEEIAMTLLLLPVLSENRGKQIKTAILIGLLFTFSEAVLYLFNIYLVGDIKTFFLRLIITAPLHVATPIIILLPTFYKKNLIIVGFILAAVVHYLFNLAVTIYK